MYICLITWLWAGILIGVSFIATPAKFLAPSLSLPDALEIGRATFGVLKWIEFSMCASIIGILLGSRRRSSTISATVVVVAMLLVLQYFLLLPILDARVELFLNGATGSTSNLHWLYVMIEVIKTIILIILGTFAFNRAVIASSSVTHSNSLVKP